MRLSRPDVWAVSPFDQLNSLREEMDRLFQGSLGDQPWRGEFFNNWVPALDLREDKDNLVAAVELPGLKKEDIDVSVHEGVLSISGERRHTRKAEETEPHRNERFFGRFHRAISLPKPVKVEAVKAAYVDGILTVTMPKTEAAKPKQIEVSVG